MTIVFFVLTFALSWTCFTLARNGVPILLLGVFAPSIVAIALTAQSEGRAGVVALLRRVIQARVATRWYVFAVSYYAGVKIAVAVLHRVMTGAWPRFGTESPVVIAVAILISTPWQAGEEIGWRGFALPRLASRFGFGGASVIVGVIWATWHLPLFFFPGADTNGQSFPVYFLQVTALSVAIAWLYVKTNGSLLLTMLMHSAGNQTKDMVPSAVPGATNVFALSSSPVAWLTVTVLWICAAYFLVAMRRASARQQTATLTP